QLPGALVQDGGGIGFIVGQGDLLHDVMSALVAVMGLVLGNFILSRGARYRYVGNEAVDRGPVAAQQRKGVLPDARGGPAELAGTRRLALRATAPVTQGDGDRGLVHARNNQRRQGERLAPGLHLEKGFLHIYL